jgi:hypothetical protein
MRPCKTSPQVLQAIHEARCKGLRAQVRDAL